MSDFLYSNLIPSSQMKVDTEGSNTFGNVSDIHLEVGELKVPLGYENKQIAEVDRIVLAYAIVGILSGPKHLQNAGYIISASANASDKVMEGGEYFESDIVITWNNNKLPLRIKAGDAMNIAFVLARAIAGSLEEFELGTPELREEKKEVEVDVSKFIS